MRDRLRPLVIAGAALVVFVVVTAAADATRTVVDLTAEDTLTLSGQTRDVLDALDADVDITVFLRRDQPGRVEAVSLLDRYRRQSDRLDVDVVDPDDAPGQVRRLGVDPVVGGVALQIDDRIEVVPTATEGDITAALARLLRDREIVVCLTVGHGEALTSDGGSGLGAAIGLLERDGYTVVEVDLLADPQIPDRCAAVVMAGPTAPLTDAADRALDQWVAADGRLLFLADPISDVVPAALAGVGLGLERGLVLEGDPANVLDGDPAAPIVSRYSSAHPVVRRLAPTYFPGVQGVSAEDDPGQPGLTTSALATTTSASYLERRPLEPAFDADEDLPGPVTIAAAADRSRVEGPDVERTRVVVVGDVDFATNAFIREAGNAQLLRQSMSWLTQTEDLVALSPNLPRDRPLRLTDERVRYAYVLSVGLVPAGFLVAGGLVWVLRRSR